MPQRPRYTDQSFPPYSYVPGYFPHPVSHPEGHMAGHQPESSLPLEPSNWPTCQEYLFAIDQFNHGYYWEAHESWESLWHEAGRKGMLADFLKGLIKLAAAGVKAREGNPKGVERHSNRARELINSAFNHNDNSNEYCGLSFKELISSSYVLSDNAEKTFHTPNTTLLLEVWLQLSMPCEGDKL